MDYYRLFTSFVQGILISIPLWLFYIALKIKVLEWWRDE